MRKVEALRDMLSEHKTVIIKPVDVELREHFSTLRLKHEKALKEKVAKENLIANIPLPTAGKHFLTSSICILLSFINQ